MSVQKFLRKPQVLDRVGLSNSAMYELIKSGHFPKQVQLGARSVAWLEDDINQFIESKVAQSRTLTKEAV